MVLGFSSLEEPFYQVTQGSSAFRGFIYDNQACTTENQKPECWPAFRVKIQLSVLSEAPRVLTPAQL